MTHSPEPLGSKWLGKLRSQMEEVGLAGEAAEPFVGRVDAAVIGRDGLHHVIIGEKRPRVRRVAVVLTVVAIGDTAIFDVGSTNRSIDNREPKRIGGTLLRVHDGLYVPVDGMPSSAQNFTLQLDLQTGEGMFAAYKPGQPNPLNENEIEMPFDASNLSPTSMPTAQNRRSAFALEFAGEMTDLAAAAQAQIAKSA